VGSTEVGIVSLVVAAVAAAGCAAKSPPQVFGRPVTLVPRSETEPRVRGELLAADDRVAYVRTKDGVREVELGSLREALVQRHGSTPGKAMIWATIGGLASGIGLTAACSSVDGNGTGGCARIGAVTAAIWLGMGGIAAASFSSSANLPVAPWDKALRPYARFPAGLPKGVSAQSLVEGPPGPK